MGCENRSEKIEKKGEEIVEESKTTPVVTSTPENEPTPQATEEVIKKIELVPPSPTPIPFAKPIKSVEEVKDVRLVIDKETRTLTMYDKEGEIARYTIDALGRDYLDGPKKKEGDMRTPTGEYYVCYLNGYSQYYRSIGLSYPNIEDAKKGLKAGRIEQWQYDSIVWSIQNGYKPNWYTALGGEIMIHGQEKDGNPHRNWTSGCIRMTNEVMDVLWEYCKYGTKVVILPSEQEKDAK